MHTHERSSHIQLKDPDTETLLSYNSDRKTLCILTAEDKAWMSGGSVRGGPAGEHTHTGGSRVLCGVGLGLQDHWDNTGARISDVLPYSPAAESGVFNKGDRLVAIDGQDVRGKKTEFIKPLILGPPGAPIDISFIPAHTRSWSASPFSSADPSKSRDVVTCTLTRQVRVEEAAARQRASEAPTASEQAPWFGPVWEDMKKATSKAGKNMENGFLAVGDKLGEAGSAIGKSAKVCVCVHARACVSLDGSYHVWEEDSAWLSGCRG